MPKLKFCLKCKKYTLKDLCVQCQEKTKQAGYKYLRILKNPDDCQK